MAEMHEGVCGNHIGGQALAAKILRTGYYWPTIKMDLYGAEALIPVEVSVPTLRAELYDQSNDLQARTAELDLVEEERDISAIKQRARKQFIERRQNKRVVHRSFNKGDLVLRRTEEVRKTPAHGKLAANWEGPFRVLQNLGKGAYKLETLKGDQLPGTWNVSSLREYQ
ncbi:uncharacterized protein [Arachis hypogaea]|uniref:uncharacterized protein n=1 Tax=Arachis hypogaea TaxID=3818 RepID=UPI003B20C103